MARCGSLRRSKNWPARSYMPLLKSALAMVSRSAGLKASRPSYRLTTEAARAARPPLR